MNATTWKAKNVAPALRKRLREIVFENAQRLVDQAKIGAPVDTGFLRNSIQQDPVNEVTSIVFVGAEYGVHVNYGTRHQAAQPFFTQAIETVRPQFEADIARLK